MNKDRTKQSTIITTTPQQTQKVGFSVARDFLREKKHNKAIIIGLEGDLGSGKTTFIQGFAKGLGIKEKVLSPTFVIMKKFQIPTNKFQTKERFQNFYHVDAYRIDKAKEMLELGWKDIIANPANLVLIEWADRIKGVIPKDAARIDFQTVGENKRQLHFVRGYGKI